jgi:hypothetical protein
MVSAANGPYPTYSTVQCAAPRAVSTRYSPTTAHGAVSMRDYTYRRLLLRALRQFTDPTGPINRASQEEETQTPSIPRDSIPLRHSGDERLLTVTTANFDRLLFLVGGTNYMAIRC